MVRLQTAMATATAYLAKGVVTFDFDHRSKLKTQRVARQVANKEAIKV